MRKVALILAIVLVFSMPLNVSAASRTLGISPSLDFKGTEAICEVEVVGNNASEHIEVTMKLMRGSYCEASWYGDGYGYVYMLEHDYVIRGITYQLVVQVTVNDVAQSPVSVSKTC